MSAGQVTAGLVVWLAAATPSLWAAPLHADLDQDGLLDRVVLPEGAPASGLLVSLSGTPGVLRLPLCRPVRHVEAVDLDGDGDLDLRAARADLRVKAWINAGSGVFVRASAGRIPRHVPVRLGALRTVAPPVGATLGLLDGALALPTEGPRLWVPPIRAPTRPARTAPVVPPLLLLDFSRAPPLS